MTATPITHAEARGLLAPLRRYPKVALAVSGGPDSFALLHLAALLRAELGLELSVLTVDHGLRASSRDEALMVGRLAAELGLTHTILDWTKHEPRSASLQARARAARYDLMAAHCHAHDIPALVTAHHLDDQAETFLMRLKRGSGLDGLAAIPECGAWAGIAVLRPLLDVPKARLIATLEQAGVNFISDPSNADPRFERAGVRASGDALSLLGLTPEALALSARRLRRAREALEAGAQSFLAANSETNAAGYALIDTEALAAAPQEIALRALAQLIGVVGGGETPLQLAKLEALLAGLRAHPGKAHTLGRCRIEARAGQLGIFREMRGKGLPVMQLLPGTRALWDNRFRVELGADAPEPILVRALGESGWRELKDRSALAASLPRLAGRTLPACWQGEILLGLPMLGRELGAEPASLFCRATFVSAAPPGGTAAGSSR
ncbi:MAG: tRNA lysidine(34) synthetase TilS [Methyloceanibacter sp.]